MKTIWLLSLLPMFLALGIHGQCTYDSLVAMIPELAGNLTTSLAVNGQVNDTAEVAVYCTDPAQITSLGKKFFVSCTNSNWTDVSNFDFECRNPGNCTAPGPPMPPAESGLSMSTSIVKLEGDVAMYNCSNKWYKIDKLKNYFELPCTAPGGTFPTAVTWPTCENPIPPPPPCTCLGDVDMETPASNILLDNFCRNMSMQGYLNPPSKKRCGTRNVASPTIDNFCYCDSVETASGQSFWFTLRLLTEPWEWLLDYSTKKNTSFLAQPTSAIYIKKKYQIEKAIDDAIAKSTISFGYVESFVGKFSQGAVVPNGVFPKIKPTTTITTTTVLTTTTTGAGGAATVSATTVSATTISTTTVVTDTTTTTTTTTTAAVVRKKRQASTFSGYTYINVLLNAQFLAADSPTLAEFTALYNSFTTTNAGRLSTDIKLDTTCPPDVCKISTVPIKCNNNFLNKILPDYEIFTKNGIYNPLDVNSTFPLDIGDLVELRCKQSVGPMKYPLIDDKDSDPNDHTLVTYCMYPPTAGTQGLFALEVGGAPPCTTICTDWFPVAEPSSKLTLVNISMLASKGAMKPVSSITYDANFFLYAGDKLVYECMENQTTVYGGVNKSTSFFGCTAEGIYDTPPPGKRWPPCQPETDIVIAGVQLMLNWYDSTISDRFKLIEFRDSDNMKEVVMPINYFTSVTIPVLLGLICFILLCCCCTSSGSPICRLCDSKA